MQPCDHMFSNRIWFNSLAPGKSSCSFKSVIIKLIWHANIWNTSSEIAIRIPLNPMWEVYTGSGNGLVLGGNKPLSEPLFTHILKGCRCYFISSAATVLTRKIWHIFFQDWMVINDSKLPLGTGWCHSKWQTRSKKSHGTSTVQVLTSIDIPMQPPTSCERLTSWDSIQLITSNNLLICIQGLNNAPSAGTGDVVIHVIMKWLFMSYSWTLILLFILSYGM